MRRTPPLVVFVLPQVARLEWMGGLQEGAARANPPLANLRVTFDSLRDSGID
jgi:hypothetical protein